MTVIDLIPEPCKVSKYRRRHRRFWTITLMTMASAIAGWTGFRYLHYLQPSQQLQNAAQEQEYLRQKINMLHGKEKYFDLWIKQAALLEELSCYDDFVSVIEYLTANSPDLIYLERMEFDRVEKSPGQKATYSSSSAKASGMFAIKGQPAYTAGTTKGAFLPSVLLRLKGRAINYQTVADYLSVLRSGKIFTYVSLGYSRRRPADSARTRETVEFEIVGELLGRSTPVDLDYAQRITTENF